MSNLSEIKEEANKKIKVIMHYLPPAHTNMPSPSFSVLKSFLEGKGIESKILYWNEWISSKLAEIVPFRKLRNLSNIDIFNLLPFLSKLAEENNSEEAKERILANLMSISPELTMKGKNECEETLQQIKNKILSFIEEKINTLAVENLVAFCFSSKFYQWISAIPVVKILKLRYPHIKHIIGGFGSSKEAVTFMTKCPDMDFAVWGEGEYPLLHLLEYLEANDGKTKPDSIPRIVYRKQESVIVSEATGEFVDFSDYRFPDYSDLTDQKDGKKLSNIPIYLILETSRGCHWNRCKFCYLNAGYKYRTRSIDSIIAEIESMVKKFEKSTFQIVDCDTVGKDLNRFETLLDKIIESSTNTLMNYTFMAEITHHGLNAEIIKKMAIAGIKTVQIGYEAITDNLLKKIDKKTDFADLILFVKFATKYGIMLSGANIIRGIIGETPQDIIESIENLAYLRFFLSNKNDSPGYSHTLIKLRLEPGSRFLKMVDNEDLKNWNYHSIHYLLPPSFLNEDERFSLFGFYKTLPHEVEWEQFETVNRFYEEAEYKYRIYESKSIYYFEQYKKDELIHQIVFNEPEYIDVLKTANNEVTSYEKIKNILEMKYEGITEERILEILQNLKNEFLIYYSTDKTRIISIIDVV